MDYEKKTQIKARIASLKSVLKYVFKQRSYNVFLN